MGWTAVCAGGRRPAREIAAREPSARSRRSRSPARPCRRPPAPSTPVGLFIAVHIPSRPRRPRAPPPSSTARPLLSRSSRVALHTGGAWCAGGDRRRFKARLCPAAAKPHSQASLVPQLTRRPPHRRCLVCWWVIGVVLKPGYALPPPTGTHRHRGQAPRASRFPPCVNLRLGVVDLEARPSPPVPSTPVGLFIAVHIPSRPRRPRAPRPSPTARPLLSRSSRVALHTGGAWCAGG